jgi:hypothetical protein
LLLLWPSDWQIDYISKRADLLTYSSGSIFQLETTLLANRAASRFLTRIRATLMQDLFRYPPSILTVTTSPRSALLLLLLRLFQYSCSSVPVLDGVTLEEYWQVLGGTIRHWPVRYAGKD